MPGDPEVGYQEALIKPGCQHTQPSLAGSAAPPDPPVDHLHAVQGHLHVDQHVEVVGDLRRVHQLEENLDGDDGVVLHQVRQLRTARSGLRSAESPPPAHTGYLTAPRWGVHGPCPPSVGGGRGGVAPPQLSAKLQDRFSIPQRQLIAPGMNFPSTLRNVK